MAEFLNTKGLGSEIEEIINDSKKFLIVASPFLNISERYKMGISLASKRGVDIRFIYGKENNKDNNSKIRQQESLDFLDNLDNCNLIEIEKLHAKCFINEESAIIASMNLYTFSEVNNYEMGVLLNNRKDREAYKSALQEVSNLISYHAKNDTILDPVEKEVRIGSCIRCNDEIPYKKSEPYCLDCYRKADPYNYPNRRENFCHACGEAYTSSFNQPVKPGCKVEKTKKILENKF